MIEQPFHGDVHAAGGWNSPMPPGRLCTSHSDPHSSAFLSVRSHVGLFYTEPFYSISSGLGYFISKAVLYIKSLSTKHVIISHNVKY